MFFHHLPFLHQSNEVHRHQLSSAPKKDSLFEPSHRCNTRRQQISKQIWNEIKQNWEVVLHPSQGSRQSTLSSQPKILFHIRRSALPVFCHEVAGESFVIFHKDVLLGTKECMHITIYISILHRSALIIFSFLQTVVEPPEETMSHRLIFQAMGIFSYWRFISLLSSEFF